MSCGDKASHILKDIKELSVVDLSKLVKMIEEEFGVSAAAPAAVAVAGAPAAAAAADGDAAPAAEEKTDFDVHLKEIGDQKIKVIKVVRTFTDLGLKEAKAVVDSAPTVVKEAVAQEEADQIKAALEEVGAVVELE